MTQDTRKDRRAKIVSLNVRYKSATVDEFIENHSHDVSRGGIFIKTPTPFPPGTLLKFEIRIAGDKAVIAGVGRVVWKREASQSNGETPAGMGVKFIKLDDASRVVIDRLVDVKGTEVGAAFESGNPDAATLVDALPRPAPAPSLSKPAIAPPAPVHRAPAIPGASPFAPSPSSQMAAQRANAAGARKATIMGMGSTPAPPRVDAAPAAGRSAASMKPSGSPMFPKTNSAAEMPPAGEQTVMKQAAELLEEALKGAGGSMEEIGTNPLFEHAMKAPAPNGPKPHDDHENEEKKKPESAAPPPSEAPKSTAPPKVAETSSASTRPKPVVTPAPSASSTIRREPSVRPHASTRSASTAPRPVSAAPAEAPARGNRGIFSVLAVAAVGVLGYFAYTSFVQPSADSAAPATAAPSPSPEPVVSALPPPSSTASAEPAPGASAEPAAAASASASAAPSSSAASGAAAALSARAVVAPVAPAVTVKPATPAPPVATAKPPAPTATQTAPASTATQAPAPTSTDEGAATATAAAPKPPKPTWKAPAKPKSDDDNPY